MNIGASRRILDDPTPLPLHFDGTVVVVSLSQLYTFSVTMPEQKEFRENRIRTYPHRTMKYISSFEN